MRYIKKENRFAEMKEESKQISLLVLTNKKLAVTCTKMEKVFGKWWKSKSLVHNHAMLQITDFS